MNLSINDFRYTYPSERLLMGPGPSNCAPRVLQAMANPCIGHLDPQFLAIMDETQQLLRFLFQTKNSLTIPVSGTGSAGMEAALVNMIEPGDEAVICVNGVFGVRMTEIVQRIGGKLTRVDGEWGRAMDPDLVRKAVKGKNPKLLAVVHGETSTGACSDLSTLSSIARECGVLFLVDMVTTLGGINVPIDELGIDVAYSGTQKCISCPPGLSPISFGQRAMEALDRRKAPVMSWYLDMGMLRNYWGNERKYHHTAPINMIYGFREALRIIAEEGLEERFKRHLKNHRALVAGIETMGLSMLVPEKERLPMLNAIKIPEGINDLQVRRDLLNGFGIEIGAGLGPLAGKIWRVGLMGHTSTLRSVLLFLTALETVIKSQGFKPGAGAIEAATTIV